MTEYTHHEDWDVRRKKQNWKGRRTDCEEGEKRNDQELERERERWVSKKKKKNKKDECCEILKYLQVCELYKSIVWHEQGWTLKDLNEHKKIN